MPTSSFPKLAPRPRSSECDFHSVNTCVADLTALFGIQRNLIRYSAGWLPRVRYWDAKLMIGEHVLQDAQDAESVLRRLHELKASSAEHKELKNLDEIMIETGAASSGDEWLRGLYTVVKPWLVGLMTRYIAESDPIMDAPTHSVLNNIILNQQQQISWFKTFTPSYSPWEQPDSREWCGYLENLLDRVELVEGEIRFSGPVPRPGKRPDFQVPSQVLRDTTFHVTDKRELPVDSNVFEEKRFLVFWNHSQEMQFAESLAALIYETREMPWAYQYDMARHMADEVRHTKMGGARLAQLGVSLTEVPMLTHNYGFRANLDPLVRFCMMTLVMESNGFERKRANIKLFQEHGDRLSELYEAYDVRDEMQHTNFGHVWVPIMLRVYHDSRTIHELIRHCTDTLGSMISEYPTIRAAA